MAAPAPAAAPAGQTWVQKLYEFIFLPVDKTVIKTLPEIGHLAPVILTVGTAFVALITLNYPLGVFAASGFEAMALFSVIQTVAYYFVSPTLGVLNSQRNAAKEARCESTFQTLTSSRFKLFLDQGVKNPFPNSPLYFISFAVGYCIQSLYFFSKEAEDLGPAYSSRPYIGLLAGAMFIVLYTLYLMAYGCDSFFTLMFTIIIGGLVGYFICYQNYLLLDKPGVNLLFIPPLVRKPGMDYICVTTGGRGQ
jgi:hypothetical protein